MKKNDGKSKRIIWWIVIPLIFIVIGGASYYYFFLRGKQKKDNDIQLTIYTVKSVKHTETVEVSGNIEPIEAEDLSFHVSGIVSHVYVHEGDYIKAGTLLAELDNTQQLYDLKKVEYDIAQKEAAGAKRDIELLKMEKQLKEKALEYRKLYASIPGFVSAVNIEEGDYINAGSKDTQVRIINISSLKAVVEVDELDAPLVRQGQKVLFNFDALPDEKAAGRVEDIPIEGKVTNEGIAVLDTEIVINNPPADIHPGYSFTAEIVVKNEEKILVVNKNAIMERSGRKLVFKAPRAGSGNSGSMGRGSRPRPVKVETAPYNKSEVKILSGLSEGDRVLSAVELKARFSGTKKESKMNNPLSIFGFPGKRPGRSRQGGNR